jgi:hypothetical protein
MTNDELAEKQGLLSFLLAQLDETNTTVTRSFPKLPWKGASTHLLNNESNPLRGIPLIFLGAGFDPLNRKLLDQSNVTNFMLEATPANLQGSVQFVPAVLHLWKSVQQPKIRVTAVLRTWNVEFEPRSSPRKELALCCLALFLCGQGRPIPTMPFQPGNIYTVPSEQEQSAVEQQQLQQQQQPPASQEGLQQMQQLQQAKQAELAAQQQLHAAQAAELARQQQEAAAQQLRAAAQQEVSRQQQEAAALVAAQASAAHDAAAAQVAAQAAAAQDMIEKQAAAARAKIDGGFDGGL